MRRRPLIVPVLYIVAVLLAVPGLGVLALLVTAAVARGWRTLNAGDMASALPPLTAALGLLLLALLLWGLGVVIRELHGLRMASPLAAGRPVFTPVYPAAPELREPSLGNGPAARD